MCFDRWRSLRTVSPFPVRPSCLPPHGSQRNHSNWRSFYVQTQILESKTQEWKQKIRWRNRAKLKQTITYIFLLFESINVLFDLFHLVERTTIVYGIDQNKSLLNEKIWVVLINKQCSLLTSQNERYILSASKSSLSCERIDDINRKDIAQSTRNWNGWIHEYIQFQHSRKSKRVHASCDRYRSRHNRYPHASAHICSRVDIHCRRLPLREWWFCRLRVHPKRPPCITSSSLLKSLKVAIT